jgi:hypothetical protein
MKLFSRVSLGLLSSLIAVASIAVQPLRAERTRITQPNDQIEREPIETKPGVFYITPNCQVTKQQADNQNYKLDKRFPINIGDVPHQLYTGYFIDGSPIVCLALLDFTEAQPIKLPIFFLNSVSSDASNPNAFVFRSAEGNGLELPIHHWGVIFKTANPEIIDLNLLKRTGKLTPDQKATHRFKGKAGQSIAITLDSRAQARFTLVNSKGVRLSTGVVGTSPAISRASLTLPADDTYQVIITPSKAKQQSYTLSVNLDRIPGKK